jgi:flagellar hook-associated protein 3 FlgL
VIGGVAISQTLRDTAAAINAGNGAQISASPTVIDAAANHVADMAADVGLNAARLDRLREASTARGLTFAEERSVLEDTDLSAAIAELNGMTLTLEAAQAAFARINRRTLMDMLG